MGMNGLCPECGATVIRRSVKATIKDFEVANNGQIIDQVGDTKETFIDYFVCTVEGRLIPMNPDTELPEDEDISLLDVADELNLG